MFIGIETLQLGDMVNFNLKEKYYKMYLKGKKKDEYRHATEYWHRRIPKLKQGDKVKLVKGYTKEYLEADVIDWYLITGDMLPGYLKWIMDKNSLWYKISLDNIKKPCG